jgi:hypothetical protein
MLQVLVTQILHNIFIENVATSLELLLEIMVVHTYIAPYSDIGAMQLLIFQ